MGLLPAFLNELSIKRFLRQKIFFNIVKIYLFGLNPAASAKSQKLFFQILQNKVKDFGLSFSYCQQKQPPEVFYEKGILKIFANFTEKHLSESLFFNKVAG